MPARRGRPGARTPRTRSYGPGDACPRDFARRHLARADLPPPLLKTYALLLDLSGPELAATWHSLDKLAELRGRHPGTITRHRAALEQLGLITRDVAKSAGPENHWRRWRTTVVVFCRPWQRRGSESRDKRVSPSAPTKAQDERGHSGASARASSPPERSEGELFTDTHPPPPRNGAPPRDAIEKAWELLAGTRAAQRRKADVHAGLRDRL